MSNLRAEVEQFLADFASAVSYPLLLWAHRCVAESRSMSDRGDWSVRKIDLFEEHGWSARPGHRILVLDRGAVRLEYPETWVVRASGDCIRVYDRTPPDDDCVLGVSYLRLLRDVDWSSLPLSQLLAAALGSDPRRFHRQDPVLDESRIDTDLAWRQCSFRDASQQEREALARICIARCPPVQALLTFDFWLSDLERCDEVWNGVLASLRLGEWVEDPRAGPRLA